MNYQNSYYLIHNIKLPEMQSHHHGSTRSNPATTTTTTALDVLDVLLFPPLIVLIIIQASYRFSFVFLCHSTLTLRRLSPLFFDHRRPSKSLKTGPRPWMLKSIQTQSLRTPFLGLSFHHPYFLPCSAKPPVVRGARACTVCRAAKASHAVYDSVTY